MHGQFQRFFCFLVLCFLLCFGVCAVGPPDGDLGQDSETVVPVEMVVPPVEVVLPETMVVSSGTNDDLVEALVQALSAIGAKSFEDGELDSVRAVSVPLESADSGIMPFYDLDNGQTSEPSGTLKSILVNLIGPYNPVVVEYRYQNYNQSTYSYVREIQPDYVWCASVGLFALMVFCTFRLGGALLRKV